MILIIRSWCKLLVTPNALIRQMYRQVQYNSRNIELTCTFDAFRGDRVPWT
jgi:hypothetical protein